MVDRNCGVSQLSQLLIETEQNLIPPAKFYACTRSIRQQLGGKPLYFYDPPQHWCDSENGITLQEFQQFFDELALYVRQKPHPNPSCCFSLGRGENSLKIRVKIVGEGMVGRVARVSIGSHTVVAFKAFFDPEFVWQHGPWAEIPVGIWLKAHRVVKDLPEFLFAGETWAVWEWISPQMKPWERQGLTYESFAQQHRLTRLNPLNPMNYNPHQIRLDPGGIQKEYWGRRLRDGVLSCLFYQRKARLEGWSAIATLLKPDRLYRHFLQFYRGCWRKPLIPHWQSPVPQAKLKAKSDRGLPLTR